MATDAQYRQEVSYLRERYELARRNQATMAAVERLAGSEALTVLGTAVDLDRYQYAGFMRKTLPPIIDKWGKVNGKAALDHYEASRAAWQKAHGYLDTVGVNTTQGPYTVWRPGNNSRRERAFAAKVVQGRIYQARMPAFDAGALTDPVIGAALKAYESGGLLAGNDAAANALTRQIGAYNRDTLLYNAGLDENVSGVQRVVNPNGCAWCKQLAVGGIGRSRRIVMDFAVNFHTHCKCSIETLFIGDKPLRPDYYDDIERDLKKAGAGDYDNTGERSLRAGGSTNEALRSRVQALRSVERTKGIPSSVPSGTAEVRAAIREADSGAGVAHILGKHLDDTPIRGFDRPDLHLDSLKDIADTMVGLNEKYPFIRLESISVEAPGRGMGSALAWATGRAGQLSKISFNVNYMKESAVDQVLRAKARSIETGFKMPVLADVRPWQYTTAHEFGHVLDYARNATGRNGNLLPFGVKSVQTAVLKLKGLKPGSPEAWDFLATQNSGYGKSNNWEYVAESFADFHLSGDNAQEMSKAIVNAVLAGIGA